MSAPSSFRAAKATSGSFLNDLDAGALTVASGYLANNTYEGQVITTSSVQYIYKAFEGIYVIPSSGTSSFRVHLSATGWINNSLKNYTAEFHFLLFWPNIKMYKGEQIYYGVSGLTAPSSAFTALIPGPNNGIPCGIVNYANNAGNSVIGTNNISFGMNLYLQPKAPGGSPSATSCPFFIDLSYGTTGVTGVTWQISASIEASSNANPAILTLTTSPSV